MPITGCAYYPEHWSRDRWEQDAQIMREAGLQAVRIAEFAWDKMEPEEGEYNWAWLDDAVTVLSDAGLEVVMCTPTPTPPPWLTHKHPDICRVREDGVRISTGARRHATANSPDYIAHSRRITEAITARYGNHPSVVGWQVDNEFGCGETTRSHGDHDRRAFHTWLQEEYDSLDALNEAWGTQFWGMTYYDWEHIPIPGITTEPQSPSMMLDFRRFSSEAWVRFQRMQIEIIRKNSPDRWVTHNFMVRHWSLDYWRLAADLDFVSYDNYPHGLRDHAEVAMNHDLMWSFKRRPFWIMEQQTGRVNWHPHNPPVPPQQVKLWSHQAVAHGADGVIYFRYRAARSGQEQRHVGLLKQDGTLDQAYKEATGVSQVFQDLPATLHKAPAKVAIVFDYDDLWSVELEPHNNQYRYWDLAYEIYRYFWQLDQPVDFVPRDFDPTDSGYETIIMPTPVLSHPNEPALYQSWIEQGGRFIMVCRGAVRDRYNVTVDTVAPQGWNDLLGMEQLDYHSVPPEITDSNHFWYSEDHNPGQMVHVDRKKLTGSSDRFADFRYKIWAETLKPTTAEPFITYQDGMLRGKIGGTMRHIGDGLALYIGCWLDDFASIFGAGVESIIKTATLHAESGEQWELRYNPTINTIEVEGHIYEPYDTVYHKIGK